MQKIRHYTWSSNKRELEDIFERSILFIQGKEMTMLDLHTPAPEASLHSWKELKNRPLPKLNIDFLKRP
jgi:two-component system response regulator HydG